MILFNDYAIRASTKHFSPNCPKMNSTFKELSKKYNKVLMGVHLSVSAASIYVAINNSVDVESMLNKIGLPTGVKEGEITEMPSEGGKKMSRIAELAKGPVATLAAAVLLDAAFFTVRAPIVLKLTPPLQRFLCRRNLIKNSV